MPLKKTGRLPKRYARTVQKNTRKYVERRYERRKQLRKERWRRSLRRLEQIFARWRKSAARWALVFAIGVVVLVVGLLLFSPLLKIQEIKVQRFNARLDTETVQRVLSPLFGRHIFFVQENEVEVLLRESVADVQSVSIEKQYPATLSVAIQLDPLVAALQIVNPDQNEDDMGTGSLIDFITDDGVYIQSLAQGGNTLPVVRVVDWGVRPEPGTQIVPPEMLQRLWDTETALRQQFGHDVTIRAIYLRGQEYHMFADGISLWFDIRSSLDEQMQRYRIFLQHVPREEVSLYIDLRLKDRVVYK